MALTEENSKSILSALDRSQVVQITYKKTIHSVCACAVLTEILKRQMIKYEVDCSPLPPDTELSIQTGHDQHALLIHQSSPPCHRDLTGLSILYQTAKSMDLSVPETIWPMAVAYAHSAAFQPAPAGSENQANAAHSTLSGQAAHTTCDWCQLCREDIAVSIRKLSCKLDGLFYEELPPVSFLGSTSLFKALRYDVPFIVRKRLFGRARGPDSRIADFLAHIGISIAEAAERHKCLSTASKSAISASFGLTPSFIYRQGHSLEIGALEHAFVILFYLYKSRELFALLSLSRRRLIDPDKACHFYQGMVGLFTEAVQKHQRAERLLVFRLPSLRDPDGLIIGTIGRFIELYVRDRFSGPLPFIILAPQEDRLRAVLYGSGVSLKQSLKTFGGIPVTDNTALFKAEAIPRLIRLLAAGCPPVIK